jgi:adenine-specific DNA-methyltransferase
LTITSLDTEQTLLLTGVTDEGDFLDRETCERLLTVPARLGDPVALNGDVKQRIDESLRSQEQRILGESQKRNEVFFDAESDKLDRWADDLKDNLERELKNIEVEIREAKKVKRLAQDLESKIAAQKRINELEQQRNHKKRTLFDAQDDIEQKKDTLIADVESRLQQRTTRQEIFAVRWRVR